MIKIIFNIRTYLQDDYPNLNLLNGNTYKPDIWNYSKRLVYEVHYSGKRKTEEFRLLPEGWKGINVFYDEEICPDTFIIKEDSFQIARIEWEDDLIKKYTENSYYNGNLAKNLTTLKGKKIENNPHMNYVFRIHLLLQKLYSRKEIYSDISLNSTRQRITLENGKNYQPDLRNEKEKLVYEVHYHGSRKGSEFARLPTGWHGINVFYDEEHNPETLLIKEKSFKIKRVKW